MSKVFNMVGGGGGKNISSIIITGLSSTDTVTCTKDGKSYTATWDSTDQHWEILGLPLGTFTVTATNGTETKTETVLIDITGVYEISMAFNHIYGAVWDGSSTTAWVRTDDSEDFSEPIPAVANGTGSSPFDSCYPWSGMVRVTDSEAGELVAIPKFWFKWTKSNSSLKLQIANYPAEGFMVSPAHMDRGDGAGERDVVYVGRYHCGSDYKSTSGVVPKGNVTRSTARSGIHALGETIWQFDFAMWQTIQMLYLVEYANWDAQATIGYGCGNNTAPQAVGASDSLQYCTGTAQSSIETYGVGVQYRWIEGLWDNAYNLMDGAYTASGGLYVILNPAKFADGSNGTCVGTPSNGYPSAMQISTVSGFEWCFFPSVANGSETTYISDNWGYNPSYPLTYFGGCHTQSRSYGLFSMQASSYSHSVAHLAPRLMKLP